MPPFYCMNLCLGAVWFSPLTALRWFYFRSCKFLHTELDKRGAGVNETVEFRGKTANQWESKILSADPKQRCAQTMAPWCLLYVICPNPRITASSGAATGWRLSVVAVISSNDILIELHCFQVCGTLRGHPEHSGFTWIQLRQRYEGMRHVMH